MPSTFTARNRLERQAAGENNNSWGGFLNSRTFDMADEAMDGMASYTLSGSKTLSTNDGTTDEARCRYQNITSGTGGTVTIPNVTKNYIVRNNCTGAVTFTTGSGTSCSVAAKTTAIVVCEGGNVCRSFTINDIVSINFVIDGGGAAIETGIKGDLVIDFPCTIVGWTALGDQSGAIIVDVWKDTYANFPPTDADSIVAAATIGFLFAEKGQDATLTGWTTSVSAGDILRFNVDSASGVTRCTICLKVVRTG